MASRISIKVEEEVRVLAEHCWELGNKQKPVQKSRKLRDSFKHVHLRKTLSLLFPTLTLPRLFPFSPQGQPKASDLYFPSEVFRHLLYWRKAHCITYSPTQEQLRANILRLAFFFIIIYNCRKQVLIQFIFNVASSPVSHLQVRTSWISSTYLIQLDLQGPPLLKQTQDRGQFKAWFSANRFQKWNFFVLRFLKNDTPCVGEEIRPCVHLILEIWVARLISLPLSACGNAAVRSCDKCLLVLTDTAHLVLWFLFKCPFLDTRQGNVTAQSCSIARPCFSHPPSAAPTVVYPWSATLWELPKVCVLPLSGNCPVFIDVLPSEVEGSDWSIETCKE